MDKNGSEAWQLFASNNSMEPVSSARTRSHNRAAFTATVPCHLPQLPSQLWNAGTSLATYRWAMCQMIPNDLTKTSPPRRRKGGSALTPCGWEQRRQIHRHLTANLCRHSSRKVRWQVPPKNSSHKCLECLKTLPSGHNQVAKSLEVITRGIARHHDAATISTTTLGVNECSTWQDVQDLKNTGRFRPLERNRVIDASACRHARETV